MHVTKDKLFYYNKKL